MNNLSASAPKEERQYSLSRILFIWAASALPMAFLAFVVAPLLAKKLGLVPIFAYWISVILGLVWQFILSMLVLKNEGYAMTWSTIRTRLCYRTPVNPINGEKDRRMLFWVIPFILLNAFISLGVGFPDIDAWVAPITDLFPKYDLAELGKMDLTGAWWLIGLFIISMVFNYFLGEEFLYRGVLLPKMNGLFGKWDWFANGVLFGLYHLHKPQVILSTALLFGFVFAFPSKIFRSSWMAFIIHGLEGIFGLIIVVKLVMGKP